MATVNESHSSGEVVAQTLTLAATIAADDDLGELAKPVMDSREVLKNNMRARLDADDKVRVAHGGVTAGESRTDDHITAFAAKVAGRFAKPGAPGESSEEFERIFDESTPSTLLSAARADRTNDLKELVKRINAPATAAEVKRDAADLLKAIARELAAVTAEDEAIAAFEASLKKEETNKIATVLSVRVCTNLVRAKLPDQTARTRKLLGQGSPGGKRKSKADIAKAKRAEAQRLGDLARKATALALAAEEEAVEAEEDAKKGK